MAIALQFTVYNSIKADEEVQYAWDNAYYKSVYKGLQNAIESNYTPVDLQ